MIKKSFGYGCANYNPEDENSCRFAVGTISGKSLSAELVKVLLTEGKTDTIRGFKSKAGKKFDAALKLEKTEDGKVNVVFDFDDVEPEVLPDVVCPACGGQMIKKSFGYGCANYKPEDEKSCRFAIGTIAGKTLSVANVKQLLKDGKTETIRGFKSKNGKKFDACLILERDDKDFPVVNFDFEHVEAKKVADVTCPLCGGDIIVNQWGFGCSNYDKEKEDSCRFSIGKMAEKSLTESNVKELLTNGITGTIRGFKSKTGKKFDGQACCTYFIWYGFGRMLIESLRTDSLMIGPFRQAQVLSLIIIVLFTTVYVILNVKSKNERRPRQKSRKKAGRVRK
jgi:DNA topoisomerase-3